MKAALTGVKLLERWLDPEATSLLDQMTRPPPYLLRAAIELVFGYRLPRRHEKSAWGVAVSYEGEEFEVVDWKRYQWSISGRAGTEEIAAQLLKKLTAAAHVLDRHLKEECRALVRAEEFSLDNQFHRHYALFSMFRKECLSWMAKEINRTELRLPLADGVVEILESSFEELGTQASRVHGNLLAATIFFSLTEVIFDACFALSDRGGKTFHEFRSLDWAERFKWVVPLEESDALVLYEALVKIRKSYRNESVHASPVYGFAIKGVGLIPATFDDFDRPSLVNPWFADNQEAPDVLEVFDNTLDYLEGSESTRFGFAYAQTGLAIHIAEHRLERYREKMTSIESFRALLDELIERQDAMANMDM